jgi:tyrosine-specific transport protein
MTYQVKKPVSKFAFQMRPAALRSGFVPSTVALSGCWVYMVATGLLVLEVNLSTMCELGSGGVSIISMAERTLGKPGTRFAWCAYVFIHYALLVAYISRSGEIVHDATGGAVPAPAAAIAYAATLGGFIYAAPSNALEKFNNALVAVVLGTFLPLLLIAGAAVEPTNLVDHSQWSGVPNTIPVIALAFVFHNVIPVVAATLEGDKKKIRIALVAGTAIPFAIFVLWDAAVLGSVSAEDAAAVAASVAAGGGMPDPLATLRDTSSTAAALVQGFSFFAISTSFLGFVLGLTDFLADGLQIPTGDKNDPRPFALALIPPTVFALSYPDVFLSALDSAGTFGVLTLFGCMPPLMAWSNRYGALGTSREKNGLGGGGMTVEPMVGGGAR